MEIRYSACQSLALWFRHYQMLRTARGKAPAQQARRFQVEELARRAVTQDTLCLGRQAAVTKVCSRHLRSPVNPKTASSPLLSSQKTPSNGRQAVLRTSRLLTTPSVLLHVLKALSHGAKCHFVQQVSWTRDGQSAVLCPAFFLTWTFCPTMESLLPELSRGPLSTAAQN